MGSRVFTYTTIGLGLLLIGVCFMPWVSFKNNPEVFTGFYTTKFVNGISYGKPGLLFTGLVVMICFLILVRKVAAYRAALFLAAILVAFAIRTFNMYTSSLFEEDVIKHTGIYLALLLPVLIFISTVLSLNSRHKIDARAV